ncbi:MAG TPA: outer membrane lipoprotein-sorting protein [Bacteroidales bacterium]|nr:outer membrane lipoprotein-sorting protein [Bacteroidales bacterium]
MKKLTYAITVLFLVMGIQISAQDLTAKEIIEKADDKFNGEKSGISEMTMTIVRPSWQRTVEFKSWNKDNDKALTLITAPAGEKGQTFLKRGNEMWSWNPTISRLIKLPPSMMSQGWMGSDYTNDDILKESSMVKDYTHKIIGTEKIGDRVCYKIKMTAKPDAAVIWGHQIRWIDKNDYLFIKSELYDEDGYLIRTETGSDIQKMDGRLIPTRIELVPEEEEGHKTIIEIKSIEFNVNIPEQFFSQQNMKRVRQ